MTVGWRLTGETDAAGLVEAYRTRELDPVRQAALWYMLAGLWGFLVPIYGVVVTLILWALHGMRVIGNSEAAAVLAFGCVFALVGAADALWRCYVVWPARTRCLRGHQRLEDDGASGAARLAQINDATVLLQLAGGLLTAFLLR